MTALGEGAARAGLARRGDGPLPLHRARGHAHARRPLAPAGRTQQQLHCSPCHRMPRHRMHLIPVSALEKEGLKVLI